LLYKPVGAVFGALGGVAAGVLFKRIWKVIGKEPAPPSATEAGRSWAEVLTAATAQGAVYALVKAALDRAGATLFAKSTGVWPGEDVPSRANNSDGAAARR
jgi:hypothetical protein